MAYQSKNRRPITSLPSGRICSSLLAFFWVRVVPCGGGGGGVDKSDKENTSD